MATNQALVAKGDAKPFAPDRNVLPQGRVGLEIATTLERLREHAHHFALESLAGLLELGLIEAGRMVRRAQAVKPLDTTDAAHTAIAVRESLKAVTSAGAAAEIADALVILRSRAVEFELRFLSYLLEMAFIEAFEQGRKTDPAA